MLLFHAAFRPRDTRLSSSSHIKIMDNDWIIEEIRRQEDEDAYRNKIGLPTLDAAEPDWLEMYRILSQSVRFPINTGGTKTNLKKVGKIPFEDEKPKKTKKKRAVAMKRGPNDPPIAQRSGAVWVNGRPKAIWDE